MAAGSKPREDEFVIERLFDAPRALVFEAWTDPKHLAQWWGPEVFTTRCELDARPGGKFRIVMVGLGDEYPMTGVYREVVKPERIVYDADLSGQPESWHDRVDPGRDRNKPRPAYPQTTTVTFEEVGGKTKLTVRSRFESAAVRDLFVKVGMRQGWSQSLDKLSRTLEADREISATRVLDAPRALVWKVGTDPRHIAKWWGPNGFTNTIHKMDVRPGGAWDFIMHGPDGTDYENHIIFDEVVEPERLVYTHVAPAFRATVTFVEDHGKTVVSMRMVFDTAEQRERVARSVGAVEGQQQTLDRMKAYVAKLS
jgi:uncharacterized protein YndB with AHSA1/START domain